MKALLSKVDPSELVKLFNEIDKNGEVYHFDVLDLKPSIVMSLVVEGMPTTFSLHLQPDGTWFMQLTTVMEPR